MISRLTILVIPYHHMRSAIPPSNCHQARDRDRTGDLTLTKGVLYRLSYASDVPASLFTATVRFAARVPAVHSASGRRGSNPRHQAWKACALPTELLPRDTTFRARIVHCPLLRHSYRLF